MISLPVKLCYSAIPQRPASAVLLPGDDAAEWIRYLNAGGVDLESVRLLPVPDPTAQHRVIGAVCPVPPHAVSQLNQKLSRYGRLAGRLFVPLHATFDPPPEESEWNQLLASGQSLWVWHPQSGLIQFDAEHELRIADLFQSPQIEFTDWTSAVPGTAFNQHLHSLQADLAATVEDVISGGQDDIATQQENLKELPPGPSEPSKKNWKRIVGVPLTPLTSLAGWLEAQIPESEHGSRFMTRIASLLQQVANMTPGLQEMREREIRRLLDKLLADPDEGLRYAIPLSGAPGRGVANPGSRLSRRNIDYRPGRNSGGPVDFWSLDYHLQHQLLNSYRESAEREVRLGRFRRAAYIHAQLLGDYRAAATVLVQGRYFHEAAAVYREKLKAPHDAARCLEQGGLLDEAIAIYVELRQFVKVGQLHERMERSEEARNAFRTAVNERLTQMDRLQAAEILILHLHESEEALCVLSDGWPDSAQSERCLRRYFELAASLGAHDNSLAKIEELRHQDLSTAQQSELIQVLSRVVGSYPDRRVTACAADTTRILAATYLEKSPPPYRRILRAVSRLSSEDLLYDRDCRRFQRMPRLEAEPVAPERKTSGRTVTVQHVRSIRLPADFMWIQAISVGAHYYLVGHDDEQTLMLLRGAWNGDDQTHVSARWVGPELMDGSVPAFLAFDEHAKSCVQIARRNMPPMPPRLLPATNEYPRSITGETPGWLPPDCLGFARSGLSNWVINRQLQVVHGNRDGVQIFTQELEFDESPDISRLPLPLPMHARSEGLYVAVGSILFRVSGQRSQQQLLFPSEITSITGSLNHTRQRLLATHATGAFLLFPTAKQFGHIMLEEEWPHLQGTILDDGRAVLWSPVAFGTGELRVYSTTNLQATFLGSTAAPQSVARRLQESPEQPLKLLPAGQPNQFGMVPHFKGSTIEIWECPPTR